MPIFIPGTPRIGILNTSLVRTATLWLPMPDNGVPTIEWVPQGPVKKLVDGSEAWRQLGWIPEIVMRWEAYDDRPNEGFTIGAADGNRPAITDLLTVLSGAPNSFSVSPGPSAGGFVVQSWKESPMGPTGNGGYAKGLQLTLRGGTPVFSKILGAF